LLGPRVGLVRVLFVVLLLVEKAAGGSLQQQRFEGDSRDTVGMALLFERGRGDLLNPESAKRAATRK
jgi:hypothetical protein